MQFQNSETFQQGHILFFAVSVSLNRSMDFAAMIKPIASYCPMITNMIVRIMLSKFPINAPAFFDIFTRLCLSNLIFL